MSSNDKTCSHCIRILIFPFWNEANNLKAVNSVFIVATSNVSPAVSGDINGSVNLFSDSVLKVKTRSFRQEYCKENFIPYSIEPYYPIHKVPVYGSYWWSFIINMVVYYWSLGRLLQCRKEKKIELIYTTN